MLVNVGASASVHELQVEVSTLQTAHPLPDVLLFAVCLLVGLA